ncbi:elongation factor P 5-aminopentanone reductase [Marinococcus halophilus]|uniref:Putative oxidoreductase YmfI n=1 Tax=Marinococcus halophilus TaxID=1371 RepID=A0A510Y2D1_MARHA|nr:SDR family oxidoreductase [Marinococcus halophilus]GEK57449.1 putative oxidoreductase YmfI [Marinococcus halophilus]
MPDWTLVTGASGAIGSAAAERLAASGRPLLLHYYQGKENAEQTAMRCRQNGQQAELVYGDLATEAGQEAFTARLPQNIDTFIHAAGMEEYILFQETTYAHRNSIIQTNAMSALAVSRALLPEMIRARQGTIVFVSSVWAREGAAMESTYAAAKGMIEAFTRSLAKETGPSGVRVNAVAPGAVASPMLGHLSEEERQDVAGRVSLGRIGTPGEVAGTVAFLCSPDAAYVHGEVLRVDGLFPS